LTKTRVKTGNSAAASKVTLKRKNDTQGTVLGCGGAAQEQNETPANKQAMRGVLPSSVKTGKTQGTGVGCGGAAQEQEKTTANK
jgi:hypothetical protein